MTEPKKKFVFVDDDTSLDDEPITLPSGRVIDEAGAEALVEEVLAANRNRNLIPGRKSLSGGTKHSPRVQFRVPDEIREQAEKRAKEKGVSLSVRVRMTHADEQIHRADDGPRCR
jgi:hypothetical protein